MPFTKDTAAASGKKGGENRWKSKEPGTVRNKQIKIWATQNECENIACKADAAKLSMTELIIRAVNAYKI